jgi:hypothetical protein
LTEEKEESPSSIVSLELSNEVREGNIVTSFVFNRKTNSVILCLNHAYDKKTIVASLDFSKWSKSVDNFEEQLKKKGVKEQHITQLTDIVDSNYEKIIDFEDPGGKADNYNNDNTQKQKKEEYIQKFADNSSSNNENKKLYEAILINHQPCFLVADKDIPGKIEIVIESIELERQNKTLIPYDEDSYLGRPYEFANKEEVEYYKNEASKYNLDSIYLNLVKPIWKKYIDADNFHISLCALDTIFSYFQDLLGLTHYLFFTGNNSGGKSNNLYVLHFLAYRNLMSTDMTSANIFRSLGSLNEGQVTICEDELDDLEDDRDKKRIYVNGYSAGVAVFRTEESGGIRLSKNRKPTKYNTYCFKAFAAEKLPDVIKAKGFNQRIIVLHCSTGFPEYNIKEVNSPAGDQTYENLLTELEHVRKILLMYRLQHYFDGLPNIKVNLEGREKELFYPLIRLFQNTGSTLEELKSVIDHFVNKRRENNEQTLHAQIYRSIIRLLVKEYTIFSKEKSKLVDTRSNEKEIKIKLEYLFSELWDHFLFDLDGQPLPNKNRSADFGELGEVSQKEISKILIEVFGSERKKTTAGNKAILLNPEKIIRLGTVYDVDTNLKLGEEISPPKNEQIFTDYLTNLTNLVKEKAGKRQKEILEDLQNYA